HLVSFPDEVDPRTVVEPGSEAVEIAFDRGLMPAHLTGPLPPEGDDVASDVLDEIRQAQDALTERQFELLGNIVAQTDGKIGLSVQPSARRAAIARMLLYGVRFEAADVIEAA